jgi:coproporphyrinogen III oxidase
MSSTTAYVATANVDEMTVKEARYHLKRARDRICMLVTTIDDLRDYAAEWRRRAQDAEAQLRRARAVLGVSPASEQDPQP